ncbi:MAG: SH3 beta-barrel fold-containing protein [Candidatus Thorarchaeota archaeon]|jgi:hypothetical protein
MAVDKNIIDTAIGFWRKIREEGEVTVKFEKKDGTTRIMRCTLDFSRIPKKDYPKSRSIDMANILKLVQENKIIRVYDLEKKAWRSVPIDKVEYLKAGDMQYKVKVR